MSFDSTHIPSPSDDFLYHQPPADHWAAYDQALALQASMSVQFNSYPSAYHQPRLTPPPAPVTPGSQNGGPRLTLAGSLDPSTGIFYRTPEHPRLRTAQACEKCRTRKAKCSGEHPSCKRCQNRGLVCEYAKEGRVRGPNKSKNSKVAGNTTPGDELPRRNQAPGRNGRGSEPADLSQAMIDVLREHDQRLALSTPLSRRGSLSMGEHRPNRPRPPNLNLDISNHHYILDGHGHYSHPDFQIPGTIPVSYRAYEENRSPSTSSSASMHLQNTYLGLQQQHTPMCSATNSPPSIVYHDLVPTSPSMMQGYHGADVKSPVPVHSHGGIDATLAWVGMGVPIRYGNGTDPGIYPLDMQTE